MPSMGHIFLIFCDFAMFFPYMPTIILNLVINKHYLWAKTPKSVIAISGHSTLAPLQTIGQCRRNYYIFNIRHSLDYSLDYIQLISPFSPTPLKKEDKTKNQITYLLWFYLKILL